MIQYVAYYSFGGYKDMLLGTFDEKSGIPQADEEYNFYSPFLQSRLSEDLSDWDERTICQVEAIKDKGKIEILGQDSDYRMPPRGVKLTTHGGYQLVCCKLEDETYSVATRGITNKNRDEFGRPIPFMMHFICTNVLVADKIASFIKKDLKSAKLRLGGLLSYNPELNCLQFALSEANKFVLEALTTEVEVESNNTDRKNLRCIVVSRGMTLNASLKEIGMKESDVAKAYYDDGAAILIPTNNENISSLSEYNSKNVFNGLGFEAKLKSLLMTLGIRPTNEDYQDIEQIKIYIKNIKDRHK